jgi:hypothetical protein
MLGCFVLIFSNYFRVALSVGVQLSSQVRGGMIKTRSWVSTLYLITVWAGFEACVGAVGVKPKPYVSCSGPISSCAWRPLSLLEVLWWDPNQDFAFAQSGDLRRLSSSPRAQQLGQSFIFDCQFWPSGFSRSRRHAKSFPCSLSIFSLRVIRFRSLAQSG